MPKTPKKSRPRFPPYPSLAYDYGALMAAAQDLRKPNKVICLYCRAQAPSDPGIKHHPECPVPPSERT